MSKNPAKPKDLTGSLVHYRKPTAVRPEPKAKKSPRGKPTTDAFRKLAFDPFAYAAWTLLGLGISAQFILLIWLEVV